MPARSRPPTSPGSSRATPTPSWPWRRSRGSGSTRACWSRWPARTRSPRRSSAPVCRPPSRTWRPRARTRRSSYPCATGRGIEGVLALAWHPANVEAFHAVDAALPAAFAEQAALALQVARHREDQQKLAVLEDRDRIGRDLHDLVIQRLFAIGLGLQGAGRLARPAAGRRAAGDGRRRPGRHDPRHPPLDLRAELGRRVDGPAVGDDPDRRPGGGQPGAAPGADLPRTGPHRIARGWPRTCSPCWGRRCRTPSATPVPPRSRCRSTVGDEIELVVRDDGVGMAGEVAESGLRNMRDRAERLGGKLPDRVRAGERHRGRLDGADGLSPAASRRCRPDYPRGPWGSASRSPPPTALPRPT